MRLRAAALLAFLFLPAAADAPTDES